MSYIEENLMSGEKLLYRTKLHWIVFLWPIIWFFLAFLSFISFISGVVILGVIFLVIALVTGLSSLVTYLTSEFGLTDKRVLVKVGFIRRNSLELLLAKVESIQVDQGITGRMFGYGSIIVSGTGGSKNPFHKISNPFEFRKRLQEQLEVLAKSGKSGS